MDREVPLADAARLRTLCGLRESAALQDKLVAKYWEMKRLCERSNSQVTPADLRYLCFSLGYGKPIQRETNPTLVDLYRQGKVKREDRVVVQWGKGERGGVLKRIDSEDRILVLMDDETNATVFPVEKVRIEELVAA